MEAKPELKYSFGPYVLDRSEWRLQKGKDVIDLSPKAFALLLLLVERAGTLVLKEEILSTVWKDTFVEEGNISFYITALRKVLRIAETSGVWSFAGSARGADPGSPKFQR